MSVRSASLIGVVFCLMLVAGVSPARAHFVWIETQPEGQKLLVRSGFGELDGWDPDLAGRMSNAKFWVRSTTDLKPIQLPLDATESEYRAVLEGTQPRAVLGSCDFGVVQLGSKPATWLRYTAKCLVGSPSAWLETKPAEDFRIEVMASLEGKHLRLKVLHLGKPLAGAKIKGEGPNDPQVELTTDGAGTALWPLKGPGRYACFVGSTTNESGEREGKSYVTLKDYATLTVALTESDLQTIAKGKGALPDLPEGVTSFGAAVADGWLYVYSGHIGTAHEHTAQNLSKSFRRISLASPSAWEELQKGPPLQGLALASHQNKVIRVGGMTARNQPGEDEDLISTAEVAVYDPKSKQWSPLPALPEPRSSHDCVVLGDRLLVAGGWNLQGKGKDRIWHQTAWQLDLSKPDSAWVALPKPPFQRRALSVAVTPERLYVVGGLTPEGTASTEVDVLDLTAGTWNKAPALPDGPMQGFGPAALAVGNEVFVSPFSGIVYRLNGNGWLECARLQTPRFMHRLLPAGAARLIAVAGASRQGHLASVEGLSIGEP